MIAEPPASKHVSFEPGDRVAWRVYSNHFTGEVTKVFYKDTHIHKVGDLLVICEQSRCTVTVLSTSATLIDTAKEPLNDTL